MLQDLEQDTFIVVLSKLRLSSVSCVLSCNRYIYNTYKQYFDGQTKEKSYIVQCIVDGDAKLLLYHTNDIFNCLTQSIKHPKGGRVTTDLFDMCIINKQLDVLIDLSPIKYTKLVVSVLIHGSDELVNKALNLRVQDISKLLLDCMSNISFDRVKMLLSESIDNKSKLVFEAGKSNRPDILGYMLILGYDCNFNTLMLGCTRLGHIDIVKLLIDRSDILPGALHIAIVNKHYDIVDLLINSGVRSDYSIHMAVQNTDVDMIKKLLPITSNDQIGLINQDVLNNLLGMS